MVLRCFGASDSTPSLCEGLETSSFRAESHPPGKPGATPSLCLGAGFSSALPASGACGAGTDSGQVAQSTPRRPSALPGGTGRALGQGPPPALEPSLSVCGPSSAYGPTSGPSAPDLAVKGGSEILGPFLGGAPAWTGVQGTVLIVRGLTRARLVHMKGCHHSRVRGSRLESYH